MEICDVCGHAFRMGWTAGMVADLDGENVYFCSENCHDDWIEGLEG